MVLITVTLNTSLDRTVEVPGFAVGGHLRGRLVRVQPAGKGVNVARCLASLGVPSIVTGFVGGRELAVFTESLAGMPARVELVPIAGATRTNTTILDPELGTDTHIRETGPAIQGRELEALRSKLQDLASAEAVVAFCGSLPAGVAAGHLAALMAACTARHARLAADLNGAELREAVMLRPLLIKPNEEELAEMLDHPFPWETEGEILTAARGLTQKVETVLVTRGRHGALAVRQRDAAACSVEVSAPRNTVGCGDAFLAGYLAGLWRGEGFEGSLRLAAACGAAKALTDAAGEIDPRRVEELAARANVRRV